MKLRYIFLALLGCLLFMAKGVAQETGSLERKDRFFGKAEEVKIELVGVYDSVGTGSTVPEDKPENPETSQDSRNWLRIDVPFETTEPFISELKFKFYLEGYEVIKPDKEAPTPGAKDEEKLVILSGETVYRDIPQGKKHFAGIFLPPPSVIKYSGLRANGKTDWTKGSLNLRVEVLKDGVAIKDSFFDLMIRKGLAKGLSGRGGTGDPEWFRSSEAKEVVGALLPVQDTPFWPKDYKHYPQPKKP